MKTKKMYFFMILAMLTWGMAWSSAKIVNFYLSYNNLVFLRFFVGFLTMLPFLYVSSFNMSKITMSLWKNILLVSVLFFLYNQCFFMGTDIGKAGIGGVFVTTINPIITFIIISVLSKKINLYQVFSISLGVLGGIFVLNLFGKGINTLTHSGNIYFIGCAIIWGVMTVLMSVGQKNIDSIVYITLCYLITSVISFFFIDFKQIINSNLIDAHFLVHFFIVCSAMSFGTSVYIYAASRLGAVKVSTFIFSVPFIAMGTAHIVHNESIGINVIIGGILSIIAIYMINK